jgi:hypothetical protein
MGRVEIVGNHDLGFLPLLAASAPSIIKAVQAGQQRKAPPAVKSKQDASAIDSHLLFRVENWANARGLLEKPEWTDGDVWALVFETAGNIAPKGTIDRAKRHVAEVMRKRGIRGTTPSVGDDDDVILSPTFKSKKAKPGEMGPDGVMEPSFSTPTRRLKPGETDPEGVMEMSIPPRKKPSTRHPRRNQPHRFWTPVQGEDVEETEEEADLTPDQKVSALYGATKEAPRTAQDEIEEAPRNIHRADDARMGWMLMRAPRSVFETASFRAGRSGVAGQTRSRGMHLKRDSLGRVEIVGSGEFVGDDIGTMFPPRRRQMSDEEGEARVTAAMRDMEIAPAPGRILTVKEFKNLVDYPRLLPEMHVKAFLAKNRMGFTVSDEYRKISWICRSVPLPVK